MATINALSASSNDVQNAINASSDGDTVIIPSTPGTTWTTTSFTTPIVTCTKAITIQGSTTISGAGTSTPSAVDNTVILDGALRGANGEKAPLLQVTTTPGKAFRLTGITFKNSPTALQSAFTGTVRLFGNGDLVRVDNCHFLDLTDHGVVVDGPIGVADHCLFNCANRMESFLVFHSGWLEPGGVGTRKYGDGSWADLAYFGTNKFWFIETCSIIGVGNPPTKTTGMIDCYSGGRYVFRYSYMYGMVPTTHGVEARFRSSRALEWYNNTISYPSGFSQGAGQIRGGTGVIHDNLWPGFASGAPLRCYREWSNYFQWPPSNGTCEFDLNDHTDYTGNSHGGGPGGLFCSGTHIGTGGATVLTTSDTNLPAGLNQYIITNLNTNQHRYITSNTGTTVTYFLPNDGGVNMTWSVGDTYNIRKVISSLDQPGNGKGDLMNSGDSPGQVNTTTNSVSWMHQQKEPIYVWNEPLSVFSFGEPTIKPGVDFFNGTPMPGYAPFVYPHPLVSGATLPAPSISSSLSATGTVNIAFSYQITATNAPTSFGATPLPAGLTFNSASGLISGTPIQSGSTSIAISATNATGTGTATLFLTIQAVIIANFPPTITSSPNASGIQNTSFSYSITANNSPTSFAAAPLPAGLAVNSGTGLISGIPTAVGTTNVTISATNAFGTGTQVLVLVVTATAPTPVGRHPKRWKNTLLRRRNIR